MWGNKAPQNHGVSICFKTRQYIDRRTVDVSERIGWLNLQLTHWFLIEFLWAFSRKPQNSEVWVHRKTKNSAALNRDTFFSKSWCACLPMIIGRISRTICAIESKLPFVPLCEGRVINPKVRDLYTRSKDSLLRLRRPSPNIRSLDPGVFQRVVNPMTGFLKQIPNSAVPRLLLHLYDTFHSHEKIKINLVFNLDMLVWCLEKEPHIITNGWFLMVMYHRKRQHKSPKIPSSNIKVKGARQMGHLPNSRGTRYQ